MKLQPNPIQSKSLFESIHQHLIEDERPSQYLILCSRESAFSQYPFHMLLKLQDTKQSPVHHPEGNVWNHTLLVVDQAAKHKNKSKNASVFMWAALLHDIGKPATTKNRKGKITSYDHDIIGSKLAIDFLSCLTSDDLFIEQVSLLIRYHMQILFVVKDLPFADIKGMKEHSDIQEISLLGLCDRLGRTGSDKQTEEKNIQLFLQKSKA